jgi:hypothetical protein
MAGAALKSFATAAQAMELLAGVKISARHIGRLTEEIGAELRRQRDERAESHRQRKLEPQVPNVPSLVAVEVDGGRLHTRAAGQGPGVYEPAWREDKVACLVTLQGETYADDPQPEPPASFADPARVAALVQGVHPTPDAAENRATTAAPVQAESAPDHREEAVAPTWQPQRLVRTCVATIHASETFGRLVAAEAQARNFYAANRQAFIGDGQKCNWSIHRRWFRDFVPIADFIHVLSYVYLAAQSVGPTAAAAWRLYATWMRACWQGRVDDVIAALTDWQERLGPVGPDESPPATDPRLVVARSQTYLRNNRERMDYPRYRCLGLPVTSAWVESLIKEFNYRVKGSEKFWNETGAEDILQVRAALLSDDDRLAKHLAHRPGSPYRRNARRRAA